MNKEELLTKEDKIGVLIIFAFSMLSVIGLGTLSIFGDFSIILMWVGVIGMFYWLRYYNFSNADEELTDIIDRKWRMKRK